MKVKVLLVVLAMVMACLAGCKSNAQDADSLSSQSQPPEKMEERKEMPNAEETEENLMEEDPVLQDEPVVAEEGADVPPDEPVAPEKITVVMTLGERVYTAYLRVSQCKELPGSDYSIARAVGVLPGGVEDGHTETYFIHTDLVELMSEADEESFFEVEAANIPTEGGYNYDLPRVIISAKEVALEDIRAWGL